MQQNISDICSSTIISTRFVSIIFHVLRSIVSQYHLASTEEETARILAVSAEKTILLITFPESEELHCYWWKTHIVCAHVSDTNNYTIFGTAETVGNNENPTETLSLFRYPGDVAVFNFLLNTVWTLKKEALKVP